MAPSLAQVQLLSRGSCLDSLSGQQQVCLFEPSCGPVQSSTLQARPSLLSVLHIHGSSPRCCPHSCSTEAVLAGPGSHKRGESPQHATHRVAYPQFRCVWPKRWQRLHCSGPFCATYVSTATRRPQSSVRERTLATSGYRTTDTIKWSVGGQSWAGSWSRRPERSCKTP